MTSPQVRLTDLERRVLVAGCREWGGPASCTPALAVAMGCRDVADVIEKGGRIARALVAEESLATHEWATALLMTEIVFSSDLVGSGVEWETTTGLTDEETIRTLRGLQRRLPRGRWG